MRFLILAVSALAYVAALRLGYPDLFSTRFGQTPLDYLPLALIVGLLVQGLLSPNAGLRHLSQPLLRWRAPWYIYAIALFAWPLLAVVVVALSRYLPGASLDSGSGGYPLTDALRSVWFDAVLMGPWALAWFGYGVPVLLSRHSALLAGVTLGLLTWSNQLIVRLIHGTALAAPQTSILCLTLGGVIALAVVAVWLFQRARGSVWPLAILSGMGATFVLLNLGGHRLWYGLLFSPWTALVVAQAMFAALLVVRGRMWQRPAVSPPAAQSIGPTASGDPSGQLVDQPC